MKRTVLLLVILACLLLATETEAWPWQKWFDVENSVTATSTIPAEITEIISREAPHIMSTQYNSDKLDDLKIREKETLESPITMTTLHTEESSSFWNNLYKTLKGVFSSVFNDDMSNPSNNTDSTSTYKPIHTTRFKTTTEEIQDQGFFEGFFASLANSFVNIYDRLGSGWGNSTLDTYSNVTSYSDFFAGEVDALLQNYTLPITNDKDLDNLKRPIVDALVSAWNTSLEIGKIPVVSPDEIKAKILETLQGAQVLTPDVNNTAIPTSPVTTTSHGLYPPVNPEEIQSRFLEILKKAERPSDGIAGAFSKPSGIDGRIPQDY